ncbi:hypothetical protein FACS1894139_05110 [Planctomycetales bacterium]|nr:hypothetical protein FACS1894107_03150 [Planctomycetales bacterium]GHS97078.1 hypothetical protein FACS1894108_02850 [Planctomycetales bacterium]GHT03871.1 hypothetical protein FACS1894139_05110 [Planctomycetales bacterium]
MELTNKMRNFAKKLHDDESAPGTVEWVLLVIVALIVMVAIYYIAQWVLGGGAQEAQEVDTQRTRAKELSTQFPVVP